MVSLEGDTIRDILGRVDGNTLANAGCVSSDFWYVLKEESMWEEVCFSLWPSSRDKHVKELIPSSLGGFRRFYANCFPLLSYESGHRIANCIRDLQTDLSSDFVWVVDVKYMNMAIYSKVVWGIPGADDFEGWFSNCPFRIDLINYYNSEDEEHNTAAAGLPSIVMSGEKPLKDGKLLGKLMANIRLSWIMINKRTGHVANLSSWSPFFGKRHCCSNKDFWLRFGCVLPSYNILACKSAQCSIGMKCRVSDSDPATLKITEISMHLEDMMGAHVRGRNSLFILYNALCNCKRTKDHNLIVESSKKYMLDQSELREAKMKSEGRLETMCAISGVLAFASFWYFFLTGRSFWYFIF